MNLQLLDRALAQPWAMRRETLTLLTQLIIGPDKRSERAAEQKPKRQLAGYLPLSYEAHEELAYRPLPVVPDGVTIMMLWGILGRGWSEAERYYLDAIELDDLIRAISATPEGGTVVLWFRSPGGITTGTPEAAAALRALGETRKIVAFSDDLCASAAYWLASQCTGVYATPTANVGSIGVYVAFYDWTAYLEKAGIKLELFKAGRFKADGLPGNPLSKESEDLLQAGVDEAYRQFTSDVTAYRALDTETMQGQTFRGKAAVAANLVDRLYPSIDTFLTAVGKGKV